ncbi:MAG: glycosyltransferase family 9 protein [Pseudomonadota bacterium]
MSTSSPGRHILIIKLGALGDVVLAIPQIVRLLETHASDRVTLLTAPEYSELLSGFHGLNIVTFKRKGLVSMLRLLRWLLGQSFDVVYDLQGSQRSRIMTLLTQAQKRAGPLPALAYTHAPSPGNHGSHAFDRFNAVLPAAGLDAASPVPQLPLSKAMVSRVDVWLQQQDLSSRRLVLIHAGASQRWPSKRWPEQYFLALALALESRGLTVIWLGGEAEADLNRRLASKTGIDASAVFGLGELAALGRRAALAMTNDSGPMHILSTAGLPVYAFFGPTDWQRSHALGQSAHVLLNPVPCSPCHLPVCPPQRQHVCLAGITPETVLARLEVDGFLNKNIQLATEAHGKTRK